MTLRRLIILSFLFFIAKVNGNELSLDKNSQWTSHSFLNNTQYEWHSNTLTAKSNYSASGLFFEQEIDLTKTPILTWRWRIIENIKSDEQKTKKTDDFAARIYVIKRNQWLFWKTIAINYVWTNKIKTGEYWKNPYTGNAIMLAMRSSDDMGWQTERVNLVEDFARLFGEKINTIDAIAIMTDTDNTKSTAKAQYSDIKFLAK